MHNKNEKHIHQYAQNLLKYALCEWKKCVKYLKKNE